MGVILFRQHFAHRNGRSMSSHVAARAPALLWAIKLGYWFPPLFELDMLHRAADGRGQV